MQSIRQSPHRGIINWLLTGCFLVYLLVVIGCLTRLTHSGLSITEWDFMGTVPPVTDSMWQERFEKYQQSPEFQKINYDMTQDQFKHIFFWEYIHRMTGRTMMYVFVVGFIYFLIKRKISRDMWPGFVVLFLMGAMQAVIGAWMVRSGLSKQPAVSHYRLATHLMSAFTLFAVTFWFALRLINEGTVTPVDSRKMRPWALIFFALLIIQIIYGAFTAGYVEGDNAKVRPGHIFNTWPTMNGEWMPEQVTMKGNFYSNFFENASGIQFVHRTLAVLVVIVTVVLFMTGRRLSLNNSQRLAMKLLLFGVFVQFILGVLTLLYNVPVVMGALHQTGAFFLFATTVYLLFHLFKKDAVGSN